MPALDRFQEQVASHRHGAAVCFAVPGAGKTTTAVQLVVNLVQAGFDPASIVSITFTREATATTSERLVRALGDPGKAVVVRTFHSLAKRLVDQAAPLMGWPARAIVDDERLRAVLSEVAFREPSAEVPEGMGLSNLDIQELLEKIDLARARGYTFETAPDLELHERQAWRGYARAKLRRGVVDFYDIIEAATEALNDPKAGPKLRARIRAVIIDEVQDLNYAQLHFAKALGGEVVMAVGDPCQAIFGFQGSSPQWCLEFETYWPGAVEYHMPQSYRCPSMVLDAARGLIGSMIADVPRNLVGLRTDRGRVNAVEFPDASTEAEWVTRQISRIADVHGPESIAVLARVNRDLEPIATALAEQQIKYSIDTAGFWDAPEIVAALDVMRLIIEPDAVDAAARLAVFPVTAADPRNEVLRIINTHGGAPGAYLHLLERDRYRENATRFLVPALTSPLGDTPAEFMRWFLDQHPERALKAKGAEKATENLQTLLAIAKNSSSFEALLNIAQVRRMQSANPGKGVRLMSAHKSKGTEYPFVFILGVEEGRFPHKESLTNESLIDEERRLLYVATTRAIDTLIYTYTARRDNRATVPSRFLAEITDCCPLLPCEDVRLTQLVGTRHG